MCVSVCVCADVSPGQVRMDFQRPKPMRRSAASFAVVAVAVAVVAVVAVVVVVAVDFEGFIICFWTVARLAWLPDEN